MRLVPLIAIGLLAGAASAQTPPTPEPAPKTSPFQRPEISAAQAEKDIQANRFRFYTYGLISLTNYKVSGILKKEYGIEINGAAGCVVTRDLVNRVREYNERMDKAVYKKYGKTYQQLVAEAREKIQQEAKPASEPAR